MGHVFIIKMVAILFLLISVTGCWNSYELTDLGFLMGVSLDQDSEGRIELNAQVYSPTETIGGAGGDGKTPYANIKVVNDSIAECARKINLFLGRKAQFGHMRVILIGEEFARKHNIDETLDFFYRDHETRFTMLVIITEGKAADYLYKKPFIERTIAQQLRIITENSLRFTSKTIRATQLELALQLNSKAGIAILPYLRMMDEKPQSIYVDGVAIVSKGKMVEQINATDTQALVILKDEFKQGMIDFPCVEDGLEKKGKKESLESFSIRTKVSPVFTDKPPTVHVSTKIKGAMGELRCSTITNVEELKKVEDHVESVVKKRLEGLIAKSQEKKIDLLGIGNELYKQDPAVWKKWENDWENIYADIQFHVDVEVVIEHTGMSTGEKVLGE